MTDKKKDMFEPDVLVLYEHKRIPVGFRATGKDGTGTEIAEVIVETAGANQGEEKKRSISDGTAAFIVKDETLYAEDGYLTWLHKEGFEPRQSKGYHNCPWVWVNLNSKVYALGMPGIKMTEGICDHAITGDEFKAIWGIYKKYESLPPLVME